MPKIDDVIRGDKIGKRANDYYVWRKCLACHKERWILRWKLTLPNFTGLCWACSARRNTNRTEAIGKKHPRWNDGQTISRGYVYILNPEHPAKTSKGYVKRCRLVLEEKLGRYLLPNCLPHHLNGIKDDDRPENLIEVTKSNHARIHNAPEAYRLGKIQGIREVVEWIEQRARVYSVGYGMASVFTDKVWQVKLKEWGVE